jgi:hypothetical protein
MNYNFIEIGTSDFDTLLQTTTGEIGLSIDPIKLYLDNLPDNPCVIKVNCAISNRNSVADVFWIDPKDIEEYGLSGYLRGCNSIIKPHSTAEAELKSAKLDFLMKQSSCDLITWKTLVNRYDVKNVELLKIDTEGHDCFIVNDILDDNSGILPRKIWFEANVLTNPKFVEKTVERLKSFGYSVILYNDWEVIVERI